MSPEVIPNTMKQPYKTIARYFKYDFFKYRNTTQHAIAGSNI